MSFLASVLIIGFLIFIHELGHFLVAKWCGVGVLEFAIGFGRPLIQKQIGDTVYSLRVIPLGGFVRMVGDDLRLVGPELEETGVADEALTEALSEREKKLLKQKHLWFLGKSYPAKAAIVIAGPLFNILGAIVLAIASYSIWGAPEILDEPRIGILIPDHPAQRSGLQEGDLVKSVNEKPVSTWSELATSIAHSGGDELQLLIERKNEQGSLEEMLISVRASDEFTEIDVLEGGEKKKRFRIGIRPSTEMKPIAFSEAVWAGFAHTWMLTDMTVRGLWGLLTQQISTKHISGPIGIFQEISKSADRGWNYIFSTAIFLSISLAVLNLLPIPILDGGHLLFFTIEAIRGKRLNLKVYEFANQFGMLILLLLMVFALSNDVTRIVTG